MIIDNNDNDNCTNNHNDKEENTFFDFGVNFASNFFHQGNNTFSQKNIALPKCFPKEKKKG